MTWVKICGTTNLHDAQLSVAAGADALGFIFAASSRQVAVATAAEIITALPTEVEKIGVFVNERPERVGEIAAEVGLSGVQLHGDEAADELPKYRRAVGERRIIKTLQIWQLTAETKGVLEEYLGRGESLDAILLDSGSSRQRGGTGLAFDWEKARELAAGISRRAPLIVAGGLSSENVSRAIECLAPWGVDVVSGVEREAGKKDPAKLREFIAAVRR